MQSRQAFILLVTILLICALLAGFSQLFPQKQATLPLVQLENVRVYVSAITTGGPDYAIDGGRLYVGHPGYWVEIPLPKDVIAGAVDVSAAPAGEGGLTHEVVYVGASNQLVVYRTADRGEIWLSGKLTNDIVHAHVVGGIISLAVDPIQRLVYAGTDTAGLFRLRDSDDALKSTAQLLLHDPVRQVVTDRQGSGITFLRTDFDLYRGDDFGLKWAKVNNLGSAPTSMALAASQPVALYVGTAERGILRSVDGMTWTQLNIGLTNTPNQPLYVDALAIDPLQPTTAYVAVSSEVGTHYVHYASGRLAYTRESGASWYPFAQANPSGRVTDLMPVSGYGTAVFLLTTASRTPQVLGDAPLGSAPALVNRQKLTPPNRVGLILAWIAAGLAAVALAFALVTDVLTRPEAPLTGPSTFEGYPVRRNRWL